MTPRHLAMFCLGQLGAIAGGILMTRVFRKIYLKYVVEMGGHSKLHPLANWFADYGWTLVLIPVVCVLVIPRHREEDDRPPMEWLPGIATLAGISAIGLSSWASLEAFSKWLSG